MIQFFKDPAGALQGLADALQGKLTEFFGISPETFNTLMESAKNIFKNIVTVFKGAFDFIKAFFSGDGQAAIQALGVIFRGLWQILKSVVTISFIALKAIFTGLWALLKAVFILGWEGIKNVFKSMLGILKSIVLGIWTAITNVFQFLVNGLKNAFLFVINSIKTAVSSFANLFVKGLNLLIGLLNIIPGVRLGSISEFGGTGGLDTRSLNTQININIEGSADEKTVEATVNRLRGELNRRAAF